MTLSIDGVAFGIGCKTIEEAGARFAVEAKAGAGYYVPYYNGKGHDSLSITILTTSYSATLAALDATVYNTAKKFWVLTEDVVPIWNDDYTVNVVIESYDGKSAVYDFGEIQLEMVVKH